MTWQMVAAFMVGLLIGEYYRRAFDKVRLEQIEDRKRCNKKQRSLFDDDEEEVLPEDKREPLISQEQFDQMKRTGHVTGRRAGATK